MKQILLCLSSILVCFALFINAQQQYSANSVMYCNNNDEKEPSPAFLYTCNGKKPSCQAFLIFKSQPPYNSVSTISILTSSDPSELARINNVTRFADFPTNKEVIVPVNCSCSGQYYQANTTFNIPLMEATYFILANNTYQGLSTCNALKRANPYGENDLLPGMELQVPLRCACPTTKQSANNTKYLLTYSISWDDNIPDIGDRFNASSESILDANRFADEEETLYPFTTILIPLLSEPLSSQTVIHNTTTVPSPQDGIITPRKSSKPKRKLYISIGIAVGSSLLVLSFISFAIFLYCRKNKREGDPRSPKEGKTNQVLQRDLLVEIASFDQVLKVFTFEELKKATDNFSTDSRIKGSVYRGVFSGKNLAVKRMSEDVSKEVNMLKKLNHFNLIKLHGICEKHGCFYLVFEYMENGSLQEWLRNKGSEESQSWMRRIQIALDVGNGLHYLHNFTEPAYVHRDINSNNVLLNKVLRAKIANFSLARTALRRANSAGMTTRVMGTKGYMAPEYMDAGRVTPKMDVYAFGVVMLELITRKDAVIIQDGEEVLLSAAMMSIMEGGNTKAKLGQFLDPSLEGNNGIEYALRIANLSVACLTRDAGSRPSMDEVVSTLLKIQADIQRSESYTAYFA